MREEYTESSRMLESNSRGFHMRFINREVGTNYTVTK